MYLDFFVLNINELTAQTYPELPVLNWEQRSDWLNVKALPASVNGGVSAKGDGTTDDTQAIQAAFDEVRKTTSTYSTVYMPEGNYRITSTINPKLNIRQDNVMHLRGHGRNTIISWGGTSADTMFVSNSASFSTYIGVVWDGKGVASHGFIHHTKTEGGRETKVLHKHEAFLNFTEQGSGTAKFKGGNNQLYVAESGWINCLFINCRKGLALWDANDYVITIDGCEFQDNGYGIHCGQGAGGSGHFYVRNSHFERSKTADMLNDQLSQGSSARRVTSVGSRAFYERPSYNAPQFTMQDCHISGWTNSAYAVNISSTVGRPVLIFDCSFTNPPSANSPVYLGKTTSLVHSNNTWTTGGDLVGGQTQRVQEIPKGVRGGSITSATQSFLRSTATIPGKVFDAKRDFGAKGDGVTDDSNAIQNTINAALNHGNGAIAYLPRGKYKITKSLNATGGSGNCYIGGAGEFSSLLVWANTNAVGPTLLITNPQNITLEYMRFSVVSSYDYSQWCAVRVLGNPSQPSSMHIEHVFVKGVERVLPTTLYGDLDVRDLSKGSVFTMYGLRSYQMLFNNCSDAMVMLNFAEGNIGIKGKTAPRTGFMGVQTSVYGGYQVEDNLSVVGSDAYMEQGPSEFVRLSGSADLPAGRVTLSSPRIHTWKARDIGWTDDFIIDNYNGTLASVCSKSNSPSEPDAIYRFKHTGSNPFNIVLLANTYEEKGPIFSLGTQVKKTVVGCWIMLPSSPAGSYIPNETHANSMLHASQALDHLRELGQNDLAINYGIGQPVTAVPKQSYTSNISVYPTVTTDMIYFRDLPENSRIELLDMLGRSVFVRNSSEIRGGLSLQAYDKGLFLIRVMQGQEHLQSMKVFKQ